MIFQMTVKAFLKQKSVVLKTYLQEGIIKKL
jgi:hypothetical protein